MAIRVALRHTTEYLYDRSVNLQPHQVRLRPAPHCRTPILSYSLNVDPKPHFLNWQQDPYGNYTARLVFPEPARELRFTVDLIAELAPINPFGFFLEESAQTYPFNYDPALTRELAPYLETLAPRPRLLEWADQARRHGVRMVDYLVELNRFVQQRVAYVIRLEPGVQTPDETIALGKGSCRDSSWLLVQLCRLLGLAARFVSGYLIQLVADDKPLEGPAGPSSDFTDLHAWAEVYVPGAGWIGLDPTSGLLTSEGHLPLAATADPQTAAAITGSFTWTPDPARPDDKPEEAFRFKMSVVRLHETPRVTKPYTDEQWESILELGHEVDEVMHDADVRMTMGGEPTFVSVDDRDSPEWNTTAMGPDKLRRAIDLLWRLRNRFAPGGLLHFGQGKWYPGESLPRWALGCYWRPDGEAIWSDPTLVAAEDVRYKYTSEDARAFVTLLAEQLAVDPRFAIPGYEDALYYLWRERRLPANVDPLQNKLDDPEERRRLAQIFEQKLGSTVGYVLPLRRDHSTSKPAWETGMWFLRREHLYLIPGDSPMGYRLPLDSLPWEAEESRQSVIEQDPFAPRQELPRFRRGQPTPRSQSRGPVGANGRAVKPLGPTQGDPGIHTAVRTALCVEPRGGRLHVFMPPARFLEDYLDLVTAIETTAGALRMPIRIEGYKPPSDHRIQHLQVMPDPGVIEVNVHPSGSWPELVETTTALYEAARMARLSTEKFQLDGKHTGTGGGNHIVIGGPTSADSPFLRRPDLLRSLLGFWNNHPSLSYLFSGLFIGPTSQHPRVDEARHDSLYELDVAFQTLGESGEVPASWLVDRLFRNLLVDATGNTHRTEFCIDKLFSPDSYEGRRGLVELRSFEMPPHARMSCVQQLLMRSLVAKFWREPYKQKLVRWGTELHDRFMLPHFVEQDFTDALDELTQSGYPFSPAWFAPHQEFRFPLIGEVVYRGVELELRQALEPWHVLGEEGVAGTTSRFVDSSLERVQVIVRGLTDPRHVVTCNGRRLPLHPTGTQGEFVAGVRYRAWQPPNCLHPTIPVHAPLVFDLLDTWNDRSIGGCTYHVSNPGGRFYDTFPVNGREAESRRLGRFFPFGHTSGSISVPPMEVQPEFPFTLDLRQQPILPAPPPVRKREALRSFTARRRVMVK